MWTKSSPCSPPEDHIASVHRGRGLSIYMGNSWDAMEKREFKRVLEMLLRFPQAKMYYNRNSQSIAQGSIGIPETLSVDPRSKNYFIEMLRSMFPFSFSFSYKGTVENSTIGKSAKFRELIIFTWQFHSVTKSCMDKRPLQIARDTIEFWSKNIWKFLSMISNST